MSKKVAGKKPNKIGTILGSLNDSDVIDRIIKSYQNHQSVLKIKSKIGSDLISFDFQQVKAPKVKKLLKEIDIKKAVGADTIPPKLIKIGEYIIAKPLTGFSNQQVLICLLEGWRKKLDKNFIVGAALMNLSIAFDCIPHDLIIAKLAAYGTETETLRPIYSYLKGRKQYVKTNNTYSDYNESISGVPQGSILGPILFSLSINLFFFIETVSMHNFNDDNTLSPWGETITKSR